MPVVAWVTVVIAGLIIVAAAVGLLRVVLHLWAVDRTLAQVVGGVRVIADKTSTVPTVRIERERAASWRRPGMSRAKPRQLCSF